MLTALDRKPVFQNHKKYFYILDQEAIRPCIIKSRGNNFLCYIPSHVKSYFLPLVRVSGIESVNGLSMFAHLNSGAIVHR